MDILDVLEKLEEEKKEQPLPQLTYETFKRELKYLGCDDETIEDCLFEHKEKWDWLLNYFKNEGTQ